MQGRHLANVNGKCTSYWSLLSVNHDGLTGAKRQTQTHQVFT